MTAGGGVGVLAILDREIRDSIENNQFTSGSKWAAELRAARAAIAELIAADREFDLSRASLIEVSNRITAGSRSDDDFRKQANAQHSYDRATARRASALAALEGSK